MAVSLPNHTQIPNELLDEYMQEMTGAELKVVLVICRKTFGWHKEIDRISFSQLVELTGMTRSSVNSGLQKAMKRGLIARREVGRSFEYALVLRHGLKSRPSNGSNNKPSVKGNDSLKSRHTKEKKKYPYNVKDNNYIKDYTNGEFSDWIEE